MSGTNQNPKPIVHDLGALLDGRNASTITLVAGDTQLVVHKSVLVARSPVFAAMLAHDTVEASSGRIIITDVEPNVLQQLVMFMYKDSAPQLWSMAPQLLVAADKYCVTDLKAECELWLLNYLSVENVMTSALIAIRYSCPRLKESCGIFLQGNFTAVMSTQGWAEAVSKNPEEFLEITRLVVAEPAKTRSESQEDLNQKLLNAGKNGRSKTIRELLAAGADLRARDVRGRTALHYAAARGAYEVTMCLLQAGAPVEARDRWLQTPLHTAIWGKNSEVLKLLVSASSDVNAADMYGNTPLHLAAQQNDKDLVQALLNVKTVKGARNHRKETPLCVAERFKMVNLLDMLSVTGVSSVSKITKNPETLVSYLAAVQEAKGTTLVTLVAGDVQMAVHRSVLVNRSPKFAEILARDTVEARSGRIVITDVEPQVLQQLVLFMYKGCAPQLCSMAPQLLVAADKYCMPDLKTQCELQLVQHLSVENVMKSALLAVQHSCPHLKKSCGVFIKRNFTKVVGTEGWADAVHSHPEEFVEVSRLLATVRNVSEEMDQKLLYQAKYCVPPDIKQQLARGAYVGAQDMWGRTALHLLAAQGLSVNILIDAGSDLESRDMSGRTALHYAVTRSDCDGTGCLLQAGAHVEARDRWLQTPLHVATQSNSLSHVRQLLAASSDVNAADVYGDTPLHLAAQWADQSVVQALLGAGADKSATNDQRETPADVAERFGREHLLTVLR